MHDTEFPGFKNQHKWILDQASDNTIHKAYGVRSQGDEESWSQVRQGYQGLFCNNISINIYNPK